VLSTYCVQIQSLPAAESWGQEWGRMAGGEEDVLELDRGGSCSPRVCDSPRDTHLHVPFSCYVTPTSTYTQTTEANDLRIPLKVSSAVKFAGTERRPLETRRWRGVGGTTVQMCSHCAWNRVKMVTSMLGVIHPQFPLCSVCRHRGPGEWWYCPHQREDIFPVVPDEPPGIAQ
jgi:hypothetical protein